MLKRKIEQRLQEWKRSPNRKPLLIKGCRQCGKTYSVLDFAKKNYKHVVYLNFFENPDYCSVFEGSLEIDNITMLLSALLGSEAVFEPGKTILVLDEIQECPDARTALKFFHLDGRYDVIGTGSLLGVRGYGKEPKSIPVGYETTIDMSPLDFEEFLWANGISEVVIDSLRKNIRGVTPVPAALHKKMRQLLLQYTVVGGMPDVVQTFVDTKRLDEVLNMQRGIVRSYEDDMIKYANQKDKSRILECFQSIPKQLSKENKKFQYSVVKKGSTASKYAGSLQWIEDAGIISRCYNLTATELPLDGKSISDKTIKNYTDYLIDSYLISKADCYDIKGKKHIGKLAKYYFEDVGLRNARLGFRQIEETHLMENIIYNELRVRGYHVDVGVVEYYETKADGKRGKKQLEVDFVATKGSEKYYIQSAFALPTADKVNQEQRGLLRISDFFRKIVVVGDNIKVRRDENGIITIGLRNFLLDENSLKL